MQNHFELFGLEPAFTIDALALERSFRAIQARIHPDRFVDSGEAERRASMQWSTRVNEAYTTLRDPLARARYLLALRGMPVDAETNTAMPADFLVAQMERIEAIDDAARAHDLAALESLRSRILADRLSKEIALAARLDHGENAAAQALVRELMFVAKQLADLDAAIERTEA